MAKTCSLPLLLVVSSSEQTSADLSAKFTHITAYKIRSDVLMTARFAADGQVCEMALQKRQKTDTVIVLGDITNGLRRGHRLRYLHQHQS